MQCKAKHLLCSCVSFCTVFDMWHFVHFSCRVLAFWAVNATRKVPNKNNETNKASSSQAMYVVVQSVLWLSMSAFDQCLLNSRISMKQQLNFCQFLFYYLALFFFFHLDSFAPIYYSAFFSYFSFSSLSFFVRRWTEMRHIMESQCISVIDTKLVLPIEPQFEMEYPNTK